MGDTPYKVFGARLRKLREQAKESLIEVSGAVEIDIKMLERIEAGRELPDEEILMLLINHFNISEDDAVKLWELGGYTKSNGNQEEQLLKQIMMVIPFDNRVVYSDIAHIEANKNGVVINFALQAGNPRPQSVARVGMSLEQAKQLLAQLQDSINSATKPRVIKALPAPRKRQQKTNKKNPK